MNSLQYLLFWAASIALFLLPGALVARRMRSLWERIGPGERILPAFLLSAGVSGCVYLAALALRPTLAFALALWVAIVLALLAWNLADAAGRRRRQAASVTLPVLDAPGGSRAWLWALPIIAFGWAAMLVEGGSLGYVHDSLDFAAYVNRMLQSGRIDLVSGAFRDTVDLAPDPRRGAFHLWAALLCRISGASATEMWRLFPTFLVPLALWTFYAVFRRLLQSAAVALASLLFFVIATFFTGGHFINNLAYASRLGWVYSWVGLWALALFLDQEREDRRSSEERGEPRPRGPETGRAALILTVVCGAILVGIHILSAAQYLISLGAFAWVWALSRTEPAPIRRTLILVPIIALAVLTPFVGLRLLYSYSAANPLFDHPQGLLYLSDDWMVLDPRVIVARIGKLGVLAAFLALPWLGRFRWERARAFLVGSVAIPFMIVLNPLAVRVIEQVQGHSLLFRVLLVIPGFQVLGWSIVWAVRELGGRDRPVRRVAPILVILLVGLFVAEQIGTNVRVWSTPKSRRLGWQELPELVTALESLDREVIEPSVVLSDPITSYLLPAYTRHYAMTPLSQHSSPADARTVERIQDSQAVLSAFVPLNETLRILRKYDAAYVLLNQSFSTRQSHHYTVIDPARYDQRREKFTRHPAIFESLYDRDGIQLFRVHDPGPGGVEDPAGIRNPYCVMPAAVADGRTREELARALTARPFPRPVVGGVELLAVRSDRTESAERGSSLVVWSYWRRAGAAIVLPVAAFVRLQTRYPSRHFANPVFGRAYRIGYESLHGTTFRFGQHQEPLASVFPSYLWEPGAIYKAALTVSIPPHAQPGTYTIRIKPLEVPVAPNLRLTDLFRLSDSLDGVPIGEVHIR